MSQGIRYQNRSPHPKQMQMQHFSWLRQEWIVRNVSWLRRLHSVNHKQKSCPLLNWEGYWHDHNWWWLMCVAVLIFSLSLSIMEALLMWLQCIKGRRGVMSITLSGAVKFPDKDPLKCAAIQTKNLISVLNSTRCTTVELQHRNVCKIKH